MTLPTVSPLKWAVIAVGCLALAYLAFSARSCAATHRVAAAVIQADQHHEQAIIAATQGATHDSEVQAAQAKADRAAAEVARLKAELAQLHAAPVLPPTTPGTPDPQPDQANTDLVPVVAKLREIVKAQDDQIQGQADEIHTLTLSRDSWKLAYDESGKESAAVRIALEAQMAAVKASRWRGRIEGFAFGVVAGYAGGKL